MGRGQAKEVVGEGRRGEARRGVLPTYRGIDCMAACRFEWRRYVEAVDDEADGGEGGDEGEIGEPRWNHPERLELSDVEVGHLQMAGGGGGDGAAVVVAVGMVVTAVAVVTAMAVDVT